MDTDLILLGQFVKKHPRQAARAAEELAEEEIAAFIEAMPVEITVELVRLMNTYKLVKCLKLIDIGLVVTLLERNDIQKTELLLRQLDEGLRGDLLDRLSPERSALLRPKLEYPADSVGALMAPLRFLLRKEATVKAAVKALKKEKKQAHSIICVVDEDGALAGVIRPDALLLADGSDPVSEVMDTDAPHMFAGLPVESVKNHPAWYSYSSIPVIDSQEHLVGTIDFGAARQSTAGTEDELFKNVVDTSNALGELYRIGLTAFLQSVSK